MKSKLFSIPPRRAAGDIDCGLEELVIVKTRTVLLKLLKKDCYVFFQHLLPEIVHLDTFWLLCWKFVGKTLKCFRSNSGNIYEIRCFSLENFFSNALFWHVKSNRDESTGNVFLSLNFFRKTRETWLPFSIFFHPNVLPDTWDAVLTMLLICFYSKFTNFHSTCKVHTFLIHFYFLYPNSSSG